MYYSHFKVCHINYIHTVMSALKNLIIYNTHFLLFNINVHF